MANIYGADVWDRRYPADAMAQWEHTLGAYTMRDIKAGIETCQRDDSGRVPTLGQFAAMCKNAFHSRELRNRHECDALPSPREFIKRADELVTDEGTRLYLEMCRRVLKGEKLTDEERESLPKLKLIDGTEVG